MTHQGKVSAISPGDEIGKHSGLRNRGDELEGSSPSQGIENTSSKYKYFLLLGRVAQRIEHLM